MAVVKKMSQMFHIFKKYLTIVAVLEDTILFSICLLLRNTALKGFIDLFQHRISAFEIISYGKQRVFEASYTVKPGQKDLRLINYVFFFFSLLMGFVGGNF